MPGLKEQYRARLKALPELALWLFQSLPLRVGEFIQVGEKQKEDGFVTAQDYFLGRLRDLSENRRFYSSIRSNYYWRYCLVRTLGPAIAKGELGIAFVYPGIGIMGKLMKFTPSEQSCYCLFLGVDPLLNLSRCLGTQLEEVANLSFERELAGVVARYNRSKRRGIAPFNQLRENQQQATAALCSKLETRFLDPTQVEIDFSWTERF